MPHANRNQYEINFPLNNLIILRLTPQAFDIIRLLLIILAVALRFALMPIYLQAYLNIAHDRLEEQKKEAGRITNIDLQRKVPATKCDFVQ